MSAQNSLKSGCIQAESLYSYYIAHISSANCQKKKKTNFSCCIVILIIIHELDLSYTVKGAAY